MSISKRFEEIRAFHNLNTNSLANKVGVSRQTIDNLIKGKIENPKISIIRNLANKLDINPTWLITGSGSMILDEPESDCEKKLRRYEEELSVLREEVKILNKMQAVLYKKIDFLTKNNSKKE